MTPHAASARPARTAVVAVTAGAVLLLAGCSLGDGFRKTASADTTVTEAVTAVELAGVRAGSIEVTAGAGPGVTVRRTVHYRASTVPATGQQVTGGVLTFSTDCSGGCSVDYRLEVPATATVRLRSGSGDIRVSGVAGAELTSDSGDVRAERIAGPLKVRTSSGTITGTALTGPSADVRSASGDTGLDFARTPDAVRTESTSGEVTLKVPRAPYRVAVSTTSGSREVTVPTDDAAASRLSVTTTSGDVRVSAG
ncbi:DUF4097 family beta strand repeat-containing protein [Streptomyces subrutilus]|uniref:DUF4097 family beta strand repeat-containing protein n=1 Tax=Streptomyces subrutilus TaxID=36818 RepID=UPI0033CD256E